MYVFSNAYFSPPISLQAHFPPHGSIREIAVTVTDAAVSKGDKGLVVVGASVVPLTLADRLERGEGNWAGNLFGFLGLPGVGLVRLRWQLSDLGLHGLHRWHSTHLLHYLYVLIGLDEQIGQALPGSEQGSHPCRLPAQMMLSRRRRTGRNWRGATQEGSRRWAWQPASMEAAAPR